SLSICTLYIISLCSEHYLQSHIWEHIIKKHLFRVFLWSFGALLFVHWGLAFWNLNAFIHEHMIWVLLLGALIGLIPESGPHLIFVMMYAQGLIPFSVLFTTSFVQDGHGMLPLLSYSLKDSVLIKMFNIVFGLFSGGVLFALGF
ncbi:MAG: selenocysteine protein, partial [Deltaproteobacteria bacterium]|nr:selenocysteine protein [Deltaproteobacteria bacterium]